MEQRSEAWFKSRVGKITGSRVGAILGCNPWQKPADVMRAMVREYHGAPKEFTGNIATEYGTFSEEYALADLKNLGYSVEEVGFIVHPDLEWLGASPDGLIGTDMVLEIKCPYGMRNQKDEDGFKSINAQDHYYAQVQIEMFCTGRTECLFFQWCDYANIIERVNFDPRWIEENIPKLHDFYQQYLAEIKAPGRHLDRMIEKPILEARYLAALAAYDQAKEDIDDIKSELIALADGQKTHVSGLIVQPIERKGNVDYKKIPELQGVDLETYRGSPVSSWRVTRA